MLLGFLLSYIITCIFSFFLLFKTDIQFGSEKQAKVTFNWKKKIIGYTVQKLDPFLFSTIPLVVMEWLASDEVHVGLFAAVISIISLAFIGIRPFGILIGPEISAALSQSREHLFNTMKKYMIICFIIGAVVTSAFALSAKYILLLYKSNFIAALPYLYISLINIITYSISMPLSRMLMYSKQGHIIGSRLTVILLFIQAAACLSLTYFYGIAGAVACFVGINIVYNIAMFIIARWIFQNEMKPQSELEQLHE